MLATILNKHPDVLITDEFKVFRDLSKLVVKIGQTKKAKLPQWQSQKRFFAARVLAELTPGIFGKVPASVVVFGNKTPSAIEAISDIEYLFGSDVKYIYCIRHPLRILRSLKNMPWNKNSVEQNFEAIARSVEIFNAMRSSRSFCVFSVDKVTDFFKEVTTLCEFMEICIDDKVLSYLQDDIKPVNSIKAHRGFENVVELSPDELIAVKRRKEYLAICNQFGYAVNLE